jgi:hypothetical protein
LGIADQPDLIVFTGDIADDLRELGPVLRIASERRPRLGVLGVVGNHEHFRGLPAVRRVFDASPVPLLFNGGTALPVAGSTLHVAGIDDPGVRRLGDEEHFARTIDAALDGAPSDAFHLLLSHRPEGFDVAARRGVHLTLAGHTHGGQVGIGGRSAFEGMTRNRYLWGMYERGPSRLYTSAGFGHWMPVRLGCPREAPLLVLTGGSASG